MHRKHTVPGEGPRRASIMFIGEAPGKTETEKRRPFVGRSGKFLDKILKKAGLERRKIYITNVVKVRPTRVFGGKIKDRRPSHVEIEKWMPELKKEIRNVKPKVAVLLGSTATESVLGKNVKVTKHHGNIFRKDGIIFISTFHPYSAIRNRAYRKMFEKDLKNARKIAKL